VSRPEFQEIYIGGQDGRRLNLRLWGEPNASKTPLLCLPGLTRHSSDFDDLARSFCHDRWIVCPTYRGRGRSEYAANWREYDPDVMISDMRHVAAAVGLHRAVLIGTSFGGLLSMALATVQPSLVAGAVVNDIGPDVASEGQARILGYIGTDHVEPNWPSAIAHLKVAFPNLSLKTAAEWERFTRNTFRAAPDGTLHFDWDPALAKPFAGKPAEQRDLWALFGALRSVPVLTIRGEVSDVLSAATLTRMQAAKPDMRSLVLPRVGHAPTLDEPECRSAIHEFLADL
jgi:pimeloyl-ACP methyl ester carboxylesterase